MVPDQLWSGAASIRGDARVEADALARTAAAARPPIGRRKESVRRCLGRTLKPPRATGASSASHETMVVREFVARIGWLASGDGWRRRTPPSVTQDLYLAVQGQCHSPSPHSKAA